METTETAQDSQVRQDREDAEGTSQDRSQPLNKMTSGTHELRDHDFPVSVERSRRQTGPVAVDTGAPPPEAIHPGGHAGTRTGDKQSTGDIGAIFDQELADPTNYTDGLVRR